MTYCRQSPIIRNIVSLINRIRDELLFYRFIEVETGITGSVWKQQIVLHKPYCPIVLWMWYTLRPCGYRKFVCVGASSYLPWGEKKTDKSDLRCPILYSFINGRKLSIHLWLISILRGLSLEERPEWYGWGIIDDYAYVLWLYPAMNCFVCWVGSISLFFYIYKDTKSQLIRNVLFMN